jgi:ribosome recycling factor
MIKDIIQNAADRMQRSIESLRRDLSKVRTGRAHPDLLAHVLVNYYGKDTPINQLATVNVIDSSTLGITPWEKDSLTKIEKSILSSDLGLNPSNMGNMLRIPMPSLNEDRRRGLVKLVNSEAEKTRISVRNIRRDSNSAAKELLKQKQVSEDQIRKFEETVQNLTNDTISKVNNLVKDKEKDLMEI